MPHLLRQKLYYLKPPAHILSPLSVALRFMFYTTVIIIRDWSTASMNTFYISFYFSMYAYYEDVIYIPTNSDEGARGSDRPVSTQARPCA